MNLKERLNADLKAAMKGGDELRRGTLRLVLAAIRQQELELRAEAARTMGKAEALSPAQLAELEQISLTDDQVLGVLQKEAKSRRESMAEAANAGRADLEAAGRAELQVVEAYLPQPLSRQALAELARAAIAEAGATEARHIGAVMKLLTPRTRGRADGRLVSEVVRELLSG